MVCLFKTAPALIFVAAAVYAAHNYYVDGHYENGQYVEGHWDQKGQQEDADCDNGCFDEFFTNTCNSDNPACQCALSDMPANYFCCMAKKCRPYVVTDSIEGLINDCIALNKPFGTFDVEAVCGVKIVAETTGQPPATESTASASASETASPASVATASTSPLGSSKSSESAATASPSVTVSSSGASKTTAPASGSSANPATSAGAAATSTAPKAGAGSAVAAQGIPLLLFLPALIAGVW